MRTRRSARAPLEALLGESVVRCERRAAAATQASRLSSAPQHNTTQVSRLFTEEEKLQFADYSNALSK